MKKAIIAVAAAVVAFGGSAAYAQPYADRDHDGIANSRDPNPNNPRNPGFRDRDRDGIPNAYDPNPRNARNPGLRDRDRDGVPNAYDRHPNRPRWARGQRLDHRYLSRSHRVDDWRRHGWRAPPRGYAYYRTDTGDVVLAAVATGIISSVILNALTH